MEIYIRNVIVTKKQSAQWDSLKSRN